MNTDPVTRVPREPFSAPRIIIHTCSCQKGEVLPTSMTVIVIRGRLLPVFPDRVVVCLGTFCL